MTCLDLTDLRKQIGFLNTNLREHDYHELACAEYGRMEGNEGENDLLLMQFHCLFNCFAEIFL